MNNVIKFMLTFMQVYINNLVVTKGASRFVIDRMKWVMHESFLPSRFFVVSLSLFRLRVNLHEPSFDFILSLPKLEFNGKYQLKTKIAIVLIQGQGDLVGVAGKFISFYFN